MLGITFAAAVSLGRAAGETNFFDGTFQPENWTTIQVDGDGEISTDQIADGGNPGYYRRVNHDNFTGYIYVFHFQRDAVFRPADVPNAAIDFSVDELAIVNLDVGIGLQLALRQNGTNYIAPYYDVNSSFSWQTFLERTCTRLTLSTSPQSITAWGIRISR